MDPQQPTQEPPQQPQVQVPEPPTMPQQPIPTEPDMPPTPVTVASKPRNKKVLMIAIVVAILVVAGAAYGAYAYITNTPDYVLKQATDQLGDEEAFAAKLSVTSGTSNNGVTVSGDIAVRTDTDNPKNGEAVIGIGTGNSRVTATIGFFDEALFFKFGSLSNYGNLLKTFVPDGNDNYLVPVFSAQLKNIDNKWFTLSKEEIQGLAKQSTGNNTVTGSLSSDDIKQAKDVYDKHNFLRPDKVYADETIDGKGSAHFSLKVDDAAYVEFLTALKAANLKSFQVTDDEIAKAKTDPGTAGDTTIEVWVARDSKKFKQIRLVNAEKGSEMTLTVTLLTDLPKLEKLQKPTNAKPFSEFITTLLGPEFMAPSIPTDL